MAGEIYNGDDNYSIQWLGIIGIYYSMISRFLSFIYLGLNIFVPICVLICVPTGAPICTPICLFLLSGHLFSLFELPVAFFIWAPIVFQNSGEIQRGKWRWSADSWDLFTSVSILVFGFIFSFVCSDLCSHLSSELCSHLCSDVCPYLCSDLFIPIWANICGLYVNSQLCSSFEPPIVCPFIWSFQAIVRHRNDWW